MQGYSHSFFVVSKYLIKPLLRVSQGFWGTREHWQNIEGKRGTLANFFGNREQNFERLQYENILRECGNMGT